MKKNGFVFVETIVVLVTLVVGMVSLYVFYTNLVANMDKREYYDNISDLYKTNIVRSFINKDTISGTGLVEITASNFTDSSKYETLLSELNISKIYVNNSSVESILEDTSSISPNSLIEYLKTIQSEEFRRNVIVCYTYNSSNYYASLYL